VTSAARCQSEAAPRLLLHGGSRSAAVSRLSLVEEAFVSMVRVLRKMILLRAANSATMNLPSDQVQTALEVGGRLLAACSLLHPYILDPGARGRQAHGGPSATGEDPAACRP
jgi:hypothetical protein